ncbi:hypothetical protein METBISCDRAFT_2926, partial [Metschnikowia bicuspidata]
TLTIKVESPPVILYGHAHESSGFILSGVLTLDVQAPAQKNSGLCSTRLAPAALDASECVPDVHLLSVTLQLVQTFHVTKPFVPSPMAQCTACTHRTTVLAEWDVLLLRCAFPAGSYAYPFSHLLPGLLAATSKLGESSSATHIRYELVASARTADGKEATAALPVEILRSILRGPDKNSLRVFPPTEVVTSAVIPGVMYPKSTLPIELRLENIVNKCQTRRWRMRMLLWKLEENTQVRAFACNKHQKLAAALQEQEKTQENSTRGGKRGLRGGFESTFKISGKHHLMAHTLMFVSRMPPGAALLSPVGALHAPQGLLYLQVLRNQDVELPTEDAPTNRVIDEVVNFDEDFGSFSAAPRDSAARVPTRTASVALPASQSCETDLCAQEDLYIEELRVVGHGDVKSGWKSDFLGRGRIELVLDINILSCSTGTRLNMTKASSDEAAKKDRIEILLNDANVCCDVSDPVLGVHVSHLLIVEMIVAEEQVRPVRPDALHPVSTSGSPATLATQPGVPTGSVRVLRMQFKVTLTERSGLGIAWDDEVPPAYHDIKTLTPPTYSSPS